MHAHIREVEKGSGCSVKCLLSWWAQLCKVWEPLLFLNIFKLIFVSVLYQLYRLLQFHKCNVFIQGHYFFWQVMSHATETALYDGSHCSNQCYSNLPWLGVHALQFRVLQLLTCCV